MKTKVIFEYDTIVSFEKRKEEAMKIKEKYPGKIPIIVQQTKNSKLKLPETFKCKFLIPGDQNIGTFMMELRKRINLQPEQALFIFIDNNSIPSSNVSIKDVYDGNKDTDGFLKICFCEENTFG